MNRIKLAIISAIFAFVVFDFMRAFFSIHIEHGDDAL